MAWDRRNLLSMSQLDPADIELVLETAGRLREIGTRPVKKVPTLRGKTVVLMFYEPSTRTRSSFEVAAKRLSCDTLSISASTSSIVKGETLLDTLRNLEAMGPDLVVLRHSMAGAGDMLARRLGVGVINAGDGMHEHPTQALLDLMTIAERKGGIDGLTVAIVGDIAHSRVARSDIIGLRTMGARVRVFGPPTLLPPEVESLGVEVAGSREEAVAGADVVMALRIQRERLGEQLLPSLREYFELFSIGPQQMALAKDDAILMHPGPVNWGVELDPALMHWERSVILYQVECGVAVRMALLYLMLAGEGA